jgi:hypothetical protein
VSEPVQPTVSETEPAPAPTRPKHTVRTILLSATGAVLGIVIANLVIGGIRGVADNTPIISDTTKSPGALPDIHVSTNKLQAKIESYVKSTKAAVSLPKRLDDVTTWTDVKAEVGDIHYFYTIDASVDPSQLTVDVLKPVVQSQVCAIPSAAAALKDDIDFDYTYAFDGSTTTYEFALTGDDCV